MVLTKEEYDKMVQHVIDNPSQGLQRYTAQDSQGNVFAITQYVEDGVYKEEKILLKGVLVFDKTN